MQVTDLSDYSLLKLYSVLRDYLENELPEDYNVSTAIIEKSGLLFDIVKAEDRRCCCFTKA